MLHDFITLHREEIIRRCRMKVAARSVPPPTEAEIEHGVPVFLEQLVEALRLRITSSPDINRSAVLHGYALQHLGFTVSQVVHDYGNVCQSVTELAAETGTLIATEDFRVLNQCLDDAIAGAVTEFGHERNQATLDGETARGSERLGFLAHELRNLTGTALFAFEVLKTGNVGVAGSTGAVLQRSLESMRSLIGRSLAEVRLTQTIQQREQFLVAEFIRDLEPAATIEANARGISLTIAPVQAHLLIAADRQVLASVVNNLLQNAFKFTKPRTTVTLRVGASDERVLIEIQDECGGLPDGNVSELFRPFEQRGGDRTGVGLGLPYCRWGVEANKGRLYARSLSNRGCVFTIDMPRVSTVAMA